MKGDGVVDGEPVIVKEIFPRIRLELSHNRFDSHASLLHIGSDRRRRRRTKYTGEDEKLHHVEHQALVSSAGTILHSERMISWVNKSVFFVRRLSSPGVFVIELWPVHAADIHKRMALGAILDGAVL